MFEDGKFPDGLDNNRGRTCRDEKYHGGKYPSCKSPEGENVMNWFYENRIEIIDYKLIWKQSNIIVCSILCLSWNQMDFFYFSNQNENF